MIEKKEKVDGLNSQLDMQRMIQSEDYDGLKKELEELMNVCEELRQEKRLLDEEFENLNAEYQRNNYNDTRVLRNVNKGTKVGIGRERQPRANKSYSNSNRYKFSKKNSKSKRNKKNDEANDEVISKGDLIASLRIYGTKNIDKIINNQVSR